MKDTDTKTRGVDAKLALRFLKSLNVHGLARTSCLCTVCGESFVFAKSSGMDPACPRCGSHSGNPARGQFLRSLARQHRHSDPFGLRNTTILVKNAQLGRYFVRGG